MDNHPKYKNSRNLDRIKKEYAEKYFYGIDKEMDLVKISKAYMAIVGDGRGNIVQADSLKNPKEWSVKAKHSFTENGKLKKFDIVLTNPPFGSKIKIISGSILENYDLGHKWKYDKKNGKWIKQPETKKTPPQILFIERCLQFLKDGGMLGIVLPETYFHAPKDRYVLEYIKRNNNIISIIDLAHNAFRPHNNAKTILLILQKNRPQQDNILMGVAEEVGHDHLGKEIYRYDYETQQFTNEIWDDTIIIRKEIADPFNPNNKNVFVIHKDEIKNNIYVPRYYWKKRIETLMKVAEKQNLEFIQMQELLEKKIITHFVGHGSPPAKFKGKGNIPYIRVKDIVNWEIYKNPTSLIPEHIYLKYKVAFN